MPGATVSQFCEMHRTPRGGVDPVDSADAALAVIRLAISRPLRSETIALLLESDLRGRTIVIVDGTEEPDSLLEVVERLVEAMASSSADVATDGCLVLATVRPDGGPEPGDGDRWLEASELAELAGVELLEWFVISTTPVRPRRGARGTCSVSRPDGRERARRPGPPPSPARLANAVASGSTALVLAAPVAAAAAVSACRRQRH